MDFEEIRREFGYSYEKDFEATKLMASILPENTEELWKEIERIIRGKDVCVLGPKNWRIENIFHPLIVADDAIARVIEYKIHPEIWVTDLDFDQRNIPKIPEKTIVVVHAHGDNITAIKKYASEFKRFVATCQTEDYGGVRNIGGFTDGDRGVSLACKMGARKIILVGFDFENPVEKEGKDSNIKRKKLHWAKKIIEELREKCKIEIVRD